MDITTLFKACVKTVRTTNKSLGIVEQKSKLLQSNRDANLAKAKEISKKISGLQTFFMENKAAYLNVINYLSTNHTMTEMDRQQVDTVAENIISTCSALISEYRKEIANLKKSKQKEEHYMNIIDSLERYLKTVSKIYTEAKAIRVKKVIETHKLSKLETTPKKTQDKSNDTPSTSSSKEQVRITSTPSPTRDDYIEDLSADELQMFESENELLFNELNTISDEVKQMESKVVHIAELQEMFTEKVLQQEQDIERIATTVVSTTENMRDANDQIKQAIQRNASLRVWVLFFLLVMSFSLLFLDWYND